MISRPYICLRCSRSLIRTRPWKHSRFSSSTTTLNSISPVLLSRARANADEYHHLSNALAASFDSGSAKRLGELSSVANALQQWHRASESLTELQSLLRDPDTDDELRTLASDDILTAIGQVNDASRSLTATLVPRHPFADLPCLMEIRPGVGGLEAALFASDVLAMYQAYCSRTGLCAKLLKYEDAEGMSDPNGSDSPLQEAILEITNPGAYGIFRSETGVHRVQRVPATETKGRVHTSAASVLVLPSFPVNENDAHGHGAVDVNDPNSDYYVNPSDVRTDVMRARGAGGQHVNTTDSAVRLTHMPTNTVVAVQQERSQLKNRAKAWQILRARLAQTRREAREEEVLRLRKSAVGTGKTGRGDKIRTYNWGQQRVTDHRSGVTVNQLGGVMEGGVGLEDIMNSVRVWFQDRDVEGLVVDAQISDARERKAR